MTTLTYANPHLSYARMTTPIGLLIRVSQPLPTAYPWSIHPPPLRDRSMS